MKKRDSIIKTLRRRDVGVRVGYIIIFMLIRRNAEAMLAGIYLLGFILLMAAKAGTMNDTFSSTEF